MKINNRAKVLLATCFVALSIMGFMLKLPSVFRHADKELHALFYFSAAAFLNLLFAKTNIIRHAIIFISLYLFSLAIEYAQEYSNTFFHKKIHGRYDAEDIQANLKGLILFSIIWLVIVSILFVYRRIKFNQVQHSKND
jgi:hypothetical protein